MADRDHYEVLQVSRSATAEEIKISFRKLASTHHPDKNGGDPQASIRFKEINASYQVLSDPQRRAMYDRFGRNAEASGSPFASGGPFAGGVIDINDIAVDGILGDLLGVFGVGRADKGDIKRDLEIAFEEAAFGCEKELTYDRVVTCSDCRGNGSAQGHAPETCSACNGRGRVRYQQGLLPIAVERTCQRCKGSGKIVVVPCNTCKGSGIISAPNTIMVTIPPGVDTGYSRLIGAVGNRPRADRPPGDLEVIIRVRPHPFFKRSGDDIMCQVPITFVQAALGGEAEVPTLEGKGKLRIPQGTQPGSILRIKQKGIARRAGIGRGDQLVEVTVEVPTKVSEKQRVLLNELAKEMGEDVLPQTRGFLEKLKDLFE